MGSWRPLAGSIYPMLNKMVDESLIRKRDDGRYELVPEMYGEWQGSWGSGSYSISSILTDMDSYLAYMEDLHRDKVLPYEEKLSFIIERMRKLKKNRCINNGKDGDGLMYSNEWGREGPILRNRFHEIKRAIKHADREMRHLVKNSIRYDFNHYSYPGLAAKIVGPAPTTVDEIMSELDSSLSYLEDLPLQNIVPYEEKIGKTGDRMVKLKESLRK